MPDSLAVITEQTRTAIRAVNAAAKGAHSALLGMRGLGFYTNTVLWQKPGQTHPWQILEEKFLDIHAAEESIDQKILGYAWVIGKARAYGEFLGRQDIANAADSKQQETLAAAAKSINEAIPVLRQYAIATLHVFEEAVDEEIEKAYHRFKEGFDAIASHQSKGVLKDSVDSQGWRR